jgi:hypothetical protein
MFKGKHWLSVALLQTSLDACLLRGKNLLADSASGHPFIDSESLLFIIK